MAHKRRRHREDVDLLDRLIMSFAAQLIIRAIDALLRWPDHGLW